MPQREPMSSEPTLIQALDASSFSISVELSAPRTTDPTTLLANAQRLAEAGVRYVSVTDGALGRLSMSSIAAAHLVARQTDMHVTAHLAARRRSRVALAGDLLGASALGIHSILVLTGDPETISANEMLKPDSVDLLKLAADLQATDDLDVACGVAFDPDADDMPRELDRLQRKIGAGARYVVCQPRFSHEDVEVACELVNAVSNVPLLVGVAPLRSVDHARQMQLAMPTLNMSSHVLAALASDSACGANIAADVIATARERAQGIVLMQAGLNDVSLILTVLNRIQ